MTDVVGTPRFAHQLQVALHLAPLALRRDPPMAVRAAVVAVVDVTAAKQFVRLAVGHDLAARPLHAEHRLAHERLLLHAAAVVREAGHLRSQCSEVDQLTAALLSAGDGAVGDHPHPGVAPDGLQLSLQVFRRIGRRVQVGHGADGGISAPGGRSRTRRHGLLGRESRLAQMHMHVDQPRQDVAAPAVDRAGVRRTGSGPDSRHAAFGDRDVALRETAFGPYPAPFQNPRILHIRIKKGGNRKTVTPEFSKKPTNRNPTDCTPVAATQPLCAVSDSSHFPNRRQR